MLSVTTINTIKSIAPAVAANAETVTTTFYQRMFQENPEVKAFFNQSHQHSGGQPKALASAVTAYFSNIENPAVLRSAIELVAQKHCSLQILPEHYPIVGKHLLAAIKEVFGDAATAQVIDAVSEAYQFLANVLISREAQIYDEHNRTPGGWTGYRKFRVAQKIPESDMVTSFYLVPSDNGPLPDFKPGQYITIKTNQTAVPTSPRNYSLSDSPGNSYFRISVKREKGAHADQPDGLISNYLHDRVDVGDELNLGPPCGEFVIDLDTVGASPIVFIAGGIGVTPLLSMIKTLTKSKIANEIYFIQASRNSSTQAFTKDLRAIERANKNTRVSILFDEPLHTDRLHDDYDFAGRVTREMIADYPCAQAHFYICGPKNFMASIQKDLASLGVGPERVHQEYFGPFQSQTQC